MQHGALVITANLLKRDRTVKTIKKISMICIILYTLLLGYWMLFGFGRGFTYSSFMYNLKPFYTIRHFLRTDRFNTSIWVINLLGNIGVFIPFGILLPCILADKFKKSFYVFLAGVIILELLQLFSRRGCFDVDDIILNTLGFLIGYGLYRILGLLLRKRL
jgi:glycopeptide antibiotics resistance protein